MNSNTSSKKFFRPLGIVAGLALGVATLSSCSTTTPSTDLMAVVYDDSATGGLKFNECAMPGDKLVTEGETNAFFLPLTPRFLQFSGERDNERHPHLANADDYAMTLDTKDNLPVGFESRVDFTLNTSCESLEFQGKTYKGGVAELFVDKFALTRGIRFTNNSKGGSSYNDKWVPFLMQYMGESMRRLQQAELKNYTIDEAETNQDVYNEITVAIQATLADEVNGMLNTALNNRDGEQVEFFTNVNYEVKGIWAAKTIAAQRERQQAEAAEAEAQEQLLEQQQESVNKFADQLNKLTDAANGNGDAGVRAMCMILSEDAAECLRSPYPAASASN